MTARRGRARRRRSGGPVLALAAVAAVALGVLAVVALAVRLWPLLLAAVVVAAGYRLTARRRAARPLSPRPSVPPSWAGPPPDLAAVTADRDRLAAEVADLRGRLADAESARDAAWDAAASAPPSRRLAMRDDCPPELRAALLADPCSGARPLGGVRQ